jgi:hypothetical protein
VLSSLHAIWHVTLDVDRSCSWFATAAGVITIVTCVLMAILFAGELRKWWISCKPCAAAAGPSTACSGPHARQLRHAAGKDGQVFVCVVEETLYHTVLTAGGQLFHLLGFPCCLSVLQTGSSRRRPTTSL